jgi:hypothetical protein
MSLDEPPDADSVAVMAAKLVSLAYREEALGADLAKAVLSVSCGHFRILYVPYGSEQGARMELNEGLA